MKKSILMVAMLMAGTAHAGEIDDLIAKSCYERMPNVATSKICVAIQTEAAVYVIKSIGTQERNADDWAIAEKCSALIPFPGDWLFIKTCYDMELHNLMYGKEANH